MNSIQQFALRGISFSMAIWKLQITLMKYLTAMSFSRDFGWRVKRHTYPAENGYQSLQWCEWIRVLCPLVADFLTALCALVPDSLTALCTLVGDFLTTLCTLVADSLTALCALVVDSLTALCTLVADFLTAYTRSLHHSHDLFPFQQFVTPNIDLSAAMFWIDIANYIELATWFPFILFHLPVF